MASKIYTRTGDKGKTSLIGGSKVPKSHLRIESYGTVDELNSFIGLLSDQLSANSAGQPDPAELPVPANPAIPVSPGNSPHPAGFGNSSFPAASGGASFSPDFGPEMALLREIQDRLFTIGSSLACDPDKETRLKIPDLKMEDIGLLEKEIDRMNAALPPMRSFVLPGGHVAVSTAHIARCVCRRAERACVLMQENDFFIEPLVLQYMNRLSDYLFMLARYAGHVLQIPEIPWRPRI